MCPPCAWLQIERGLVRQKARLWACEPSPALFSRPHARNDLGLAHVAVMRGLRCARGHDTRLERLSEANYGGAKPGLIATRPTWSQTWIVPPHLPCLVTGGGRHASGHWGAGSNGVRRPMRVVRAVVRGKRRAAIGQGWAQGTLQWPAGQRQHHGENRLTQLGRPKWNVPIRERSPSGQGGLLSLARELRGGPIAAPRVVACDGQQVVFRDEERAQGPGGQAKQRTMGVPSEPFMGRLWRHVPPGRAVLVRWWGL